MKREMRPAASATFLVHVKVSRTIRIVL